MLEGDRECLYLPQSPPLFTKEPHVFGWRQTRPLEGMWALLRLIYVACSDRDCPPFDVATCFGAVLSEGCAAQHAHTCLMSARPSFGSVRYKMACSAM